MATRSAFDGGSVPPAVATVNAAAAMAVATSSEMAAATSPL